MSLAFFACIFAYLYAHLLMFLQDTERVGSKFDSSFICQCFWSVEDVSISMYKRQFSLVGYMSEVEKQSGWRHLKRWGTDSDLEGCYELPEWLFGMHGGDFQFKAVYKPILSWIWSPDRDKARYLVQPLYTKSMLPQLCESNAGSVVGTEKNMSSIYAWSVTISMIERK